MSFIFFCAFITAFYGLIGFFDFFFKSCMHYPYFAFLEATGLKVGILSLSWTTTVFNRFIYRWTKNLTRVLQKWFTCGYLFIIFVFLPFSLWTLYSFVASQFYNEIGHKSNLEVKVILPGINIPISDFGIYFIAIGLSTVIHELGHAVAAAQEDVQMFSFGLYVLTIIPVAFVQLNTEQLNSIARSKRLQIYCAGVWHNVATAIVATLLYYSTPILFNVAYETGLGVHISDFTKGSPLNDLRGFVKGDVLTSINGCNIKNLNDWTFCLQLAYNRYGICTSGEYVAENDESMMEWIKENDVVECCRKEDLHSLCFEYVEPKIAVDSMLPSQYSCLKPREMIKDTLAKCDEIGGFACPQGLHCMKPSLNNQTYLLITERNERDKVVYLGSPFDLYETITVDQYFPRATIFSKYSPMQFESLVRYIFIFSMGMAFLNVIPCYGTDGQYIARDIIQFLTRYSKHTHGLSSVITAGVVTLGTVITVPTLIFMFYKASVAD